METVETKALQVTSFTKKHVDITRDFIARVESLLKESGSEPKTYGIDSDTWEEKESLKLAISEKTTLEIHLRTRR